MADTPTQPAAQGSFVQRNWKLGLLALLLVPGMAYQQMKDRKARESESAVSAVVADDKVQGVTLKFTKAVDTITYQDGTVLPVDGIGYAILTWDDYQKNIERLKRVGFEPKEADFPIVVFFNLSGFDVSGDPGVARSAKNGSMLFSLKDRPKGLVASMMPMRDGTFKVFYRDGTSEIVKDADWYHVFMGIEPVVPPKPPEEPKTIIQKDKTGIRGVVIAVGGIPPIQPVKSTAVIVLRGSVDPVALDKLKDKIVSEVTTKDDGTFTVDVPPGLYTVIVKKDNKLYGNAVNQAKWPAVTVGDKAVEYEFRLPAVR